jgi:hypothetical protein
MLSPDDRLEASMPELTRQVQLSFVEDGDRTRADAILELREERFHGFGQAKRAPEDPNVPLVGEELAAARALSDLAHKLLDAAAERIDHFPGASDAPEMPR